MATPSAVTSCPWCCWETQNTDASNYSKVFLPQESRASQHQCLSCTLESQFNFGLGVEFDPQQGVEGPWDQSSQLQWHHLPYPKGATVLLRWRGGDSLMITEP